MDPRPHCTVAKAVDLQAWLTVAWGIVNPITLMTRVLLVWVHGWPLLSVHLQVFRTAGIIGMIIVHGNSPIALVSWIEVSGCKGVGIGTCWISSIHVRIWYM